MPTSRLPLPFSRPNLLLTLLILCTSVCATLDGVAAPIPTFPTTSHTTTTTTLLCRFRARSPSSQPPPLLPHDVHTAYQRAFEVGSTGDDEAAVTLFHAVLSHAPRFAPALINLGSHLEALGHGRDAARYYVQSIHAAVDSGGYDDVVNMAVRRMVMLAASDPSAHTYEPLVSFLRDEAEAVALRCFEDCGLEGTWEDITIPVPDSVSGCCSCQSLGPDVLIGNAALAYRDGQVYTALRLYYATLMCGDATAVQHKAALQNSASLLLTGGQEALATRVYRQLLQRWPDDLSSSVLFTQASRGTFGWEGWHSVVDALQHRLAVTLAEDEASETDCGILQPLLFLHTPMDTVRQLTTRCVKYLASRSAGSLVDEAPPCEQHPPTTTTTTTTSRPRLTIAHVSYDWRLHPSATLARGMLRHLPRHRSRVLTYSTHPPEGLSLPPNATYAINLNAVLSSFSNATGLSPPLAYPSSTTDGVMDVRDALLFAATPTGPVVVPDWVSLDPIPHPAVRIAAASDAFFLCSSASDAALVRHVRRQGVDIVVDLTVNMVGTRHSVSILRPAPIAINYLGYPGTAGGRPMSDYAIVDPTVVPPESSRTWFEESVVHLSHSYQANEMPPDVPLCMSRDSEWRLRIRRLHGLPGLDWVVLANLDSGRKLGPTVFRLWAAVLRRSPKSVLLLRTLTHDRRATLNAELAGAGVHPSRVVYLSHSRWSTPRRYFSLYCGVDLWVDTLWCSAHSTATDVLWSGVPILAWEGDSFQSRVSASFLRVLGPPLDVLTVHTLKEYEDVAVRLSTSPSLLGSLRDALARRTATSRLFNSRLQAVELQGVYEAVSSVREAGASGSGGEDWRRLHVVGGRRGDGLGMLSAVRHRCRDLSQVWHRVLHSGGRHPSAHTDGFTGRSGVALQCLEAGARGAAVNATSEPCRALDAAAVGRRAAVMQQEWGTALCRLT